MTYRTGFIALLGLLVGAAGFVGNTVGVFADLNVAGTGLVAGSWSPVTLTATASGGGTLTTVGVALRSRKIGRTVVASVSVTETNIGSGTGYLNVSGLPFTPYSSCTFVGKETATTGKMAILTIGSGGSGLLTYYDNSAVLANGVVVVLNGTCETTN